MTYKIQSDKSVKIYSKINVITNIDFGYDISLELNQLKIKKNHNYLFSTYLIDFNNKSITSELLKICEEGNFVNLLILNEKKDNTFNKFIKTIKKFHYAKGKKIILVSNRNFFNKYKIKEFIFHIKNKNVKKINFSQKIKKKLLEI